ncbi:trimethyllysine dioxygenase, mitochondrial-like isoform X2 [Battus philenor]
MDVPDTLIADIKFDEDHLYITWDDNHSSVYEADFLMKFDYKTWIEKRKHKPKLWRGEEIAEKIARVQFKEFLNSTDKARTAFQSLLDYGVAIVEDVEPTLAATEKVCNALGGVQHTMFGGMWLVHNKFDHADTAYTTISLAAHTDNTYFTEAAGLQIFQCLEHINVNGGDTILVDGFYGAQRLKEDFPEDYKFLTTFELDAEYREEGHHHRYSAPVITLDKMEEVKQIRFNVYDRTPMAFSSREECKAYYRSLKNLSKYYEDENNRWQLKLKPGTVIAIDNFRVLHGRKSFTGNRVLCGSYISRTDWLDKARTLGLIE